MRASKTMTFFLSLVIATTTLAQTPTPAATPGPPAGPPEFGPARGTLMIIGGGLRSEALLKQFIALSGGPDASILFIPTAGEGDEPGLYWEDLRDFQAAGARRVSVLHTRDRKVADSEAFVAPIRQANGVFIGGGRHWRLSDSYLNTRTHTELRALLDRGGVIAGTSAGATIQAEFMVRGDTKGNEIMIGDHTQGLGFIKGVTIDQHVLRRNRQFDLIPVIEQRPELLGIGIDEDTAIVVRRDRFEVFGSSYVLIYDHRKTTGADGRFYFLAPGDRFNLKTREAERPQPRGVPIERVQPQAWKK
jgi:cyanophycinase